MVEKIQKQNIGNSGEYYIASRLSFLNFTVTLTLGRAERFDILALNPNGKSIRISVKTNHSVTNNEFMLGKKDEEGPADDFYYAFINLFNFNKEPDFWIIPSNIVCALIKNDHKSWLAAPGRNGNLHQETPMRKLKLNDKGESVQSVYPANWGEQVKGYYKNLQQLQDLK